VKKTDGEVFRLLNEKPHIVAGIRLRSVEFQQRRGILINRVGHELQPLLAQLVPEFL
jgi:hypothetical protein